MILREVGEQEASKAGLMVSCSVMMLTCSDRVVGEESPALLQVLMCVESSAH